MTAAISAEGIPVAPGYVMPLYLTPALAEGKTYGDSHFPFDSPYTTRSYTDYRPGLCPVAEAMGDQDVHGAINERYTEHDVRDIADAITKVATRLRANLVGLPSLCHSDEGGICPIRETRQSKRCRPDRSGSLRRHSKVSTRGRAPTNE